VNGPALLSLHLYCKNSKLPQASRIYHFRDLWQRSWNASQPPGAFEVQERGRRSPGMNLLQSVTRIFLIREKPIACLSERAQHQSES
jgi:hypothetical protein